jgi:hypothetical protein
MKTMIKLAVGAAVAGALVALLMKKTRARSLEDEAFDDSVGIGGDDAVEVVPVIEVLTIETGPADAREDTRDDWYGAQAGDASRH